MTEQLFVRIEVPDRASLRGLVERGVDVVHASARPRAAGPGTVAGIIAAEELGPLVDAGYRVSVEATVTGRTRALDTVSFDEWLAGMADDPVLRG